MNDNSRFRVPWWVGLITVLLLVPAFSFPEMLASLHPQGEAYTTLRTLIWLFPLVMVVYGVCILLTWNVRRAVAIVLLSMMALTDLALYLMFAL